MPADEAVQRPRPVALVAEHQLVGGPGRDRAARLLVARDLRERLPGRLRVLADAVREALRDELPAPGAQVVDPDRHHAERERGERVAEPVVGGDQLLDAVAVEVGDAVAGVAEVAIGGHIGRPVPAVEARQVAAVRAAGVEVDDDLGLAVAVEVVNDHRVAVAEARGRAERAVAVAERRVASEHLRAGAADRQLHVRVLERVLNVVVGQRRRDAAGGRGLGRRKRG